MVINLYREQQIADQMIYQVKLTVKTRTAERTFNLPGLTDVMNFLREASVPSSVEAPLTGVAMSPEGISIVALKDDDDGYVVDQIGSCDLPHYADENLVYLRDESAIRTVANALQKLKERIGLRNNRVAIALPGFAVMVKFLEYEVYDDEQLRKNIVRDIDSILPFPEQTFVYGWRKMKIFDGRERVMIVAVKKDLYQGYLEVMRLAGLEPVIVTAPVEAYAQLLSDPDAKLNYFDLTTALIHVGRRVCSFHVYYSGDVLFSRNFVIDDKGQFNFYVELDKCFAFAREFKGVNVKRACLSFTGMSLNDFQTEFDSAVERSHRLFKGYSRLDDAEKLAHPSKDSVQPVRERIVFTEFDPFKQWQIKMSETDTKPEDFTLHGGNSSAFVIALGCATLKG